MTNDAAETAEGAAGAEVAESSSDAQTLENEPAQTASEGEHDVVAFDETGRDDESGDDASARDDTSSGEAVSEESSSEEAVSKETASEEPAAEGAVADEGVSGEPVSDDADTGGESVTENPDVDAQAEAEPDAELDAQPDVDADLDVDADMNELLGIASEPDETALDDEPGDTPGAESESDDASDEAARDAPSHPEAHLLAPLVGAVPRIRPAAVTETSEPVDPADAALVARGLVKDFGGTHAVDEIDLTVPTGSFYGIVGPNGAGKTTTLSMISGLLRPDRGTITVAGIDARQKARAAKKLIGVLPDRFRTFDRLTGRQLLHYYGLLRGLKPGVVDKRTADLARAFDLTDALGRAVSDYSAGMTKKVMLAGAMIHSPRLLVLDEPFEAVDPVSAAVILEILSQYVAGGGTVILSSHTMELVERVCSRVAVVVAGQVLAEGTVDEVRGDLTLEQRFVELSGGLTEVEGLEWLHTFSD